MATFKLTEFDTVTTVRGHALADTLVANVTVRGVRVEVRQDSCGVWHWRPLASAFISRSFRTRARAIEDAEMFLSRLGYHGPSEV